MGEDGQGGGAARSRRPVEEESPGAAAPAPGPHPDPVAWQVVPLLAVRSLSDRDFDYLPPESGPPIEIGGLVRVPFGGRVVLGVVTGPSDGSYQAGGHGRRLRRIHEVLAATVTSEEFELARALAQQYCTTLGAALLAVSAAARLPEAVGGGRRVGWITPRRGAVPDEPLTARQRVVWAALPPGGMSVADACRALGCTRALLNALVKKGVADLEQRSGLHEATVDGDDAVLRPQATVTLTAEQSRALTWLQTALEDGVAAHALLWGVTGGGKTEVYLGLLRETIRRGRGAIVLVPEIALTDALQRYFEEALGPGVVSVVHSGLAPAARARALRRAESGRSPVVIGARSAVFARVPRLGLIIIDESHDSSYKNEEEPRYQARWVARWRTQRHGALLLEGTATPRLETLVESRKTLRLQIRPTGGEVPEVEVVDMRRQGGGSVLSPRAAHCLRQTLAAGRQAVLLVNRRGHSAYLFCPECGHVVMCPRCDISLTLHRAPRSGVGGVLVCHHCGYRRPAEPLCSVCGSAALARAVVGTQGVEEEVRRFLPEDRIFRLDSDVAVSRNRARATLHTFARSAPGVLLGTQMVAKGHDFPWVDLVVVVDADSGLYLPDFRAAERTFQLLRQVCGRAGRRGAPGRALVQTWNPDSPCIRMAVQGEERAFYRRELDERRRLGFPPATMLVRVVLAGKGARMDGAARLVMDSLVGWAGEQRAAVWGPTQLPRIRERERRQVLVVLPKTDAPPSRLREHLSNLRAALLRRRVDLMVDVDPEWFM